MTFWLTGFSGAGKTTIAKNLEKYLLDQGRYVIVLDGDELRDGLNSDLGFTEKDRFENLKRAAHICHILNKNGAIVLASFISPLEKMRSMVKDIIGPESFRLFYINCPIEVCEQRDVKGHYSRARSGQTNQFTGISAKYETPEKWDLEIKTDEIKLEEAIQSLSEFVMKEASIVQSMTPP
jgi:adenylylsulfate kinase